MLMVVCLTDGTVTLLFEFDQLRNFSEILMVAYGRPNNIDVIFRYISEITPNYSYVYRRIGVFNANCINSTHVFFRFLKSSLTSGVHNFE